MAEAFVKTIKRDYARVSPFGPMQAASCTNSMLGFEHYNTVHPHKALGYRAPREFRNQMVETTTENAVGAGRRPNENLISADAIGSSLSVAHRAETRSGWLDASAAVDHP